jgi:hypothetical protein
MENKRGQFFSLFLVVLTVFLCGVVIALYFVQQENIQSSLVSPTSVLEARDQLNILELKEIELIKNSFSNVDGNFGEEEFGVSFRNNFIDGVMSDEYMRSFLFENLFIEDVEIREQDKNKNLLEGGIYTEALTYFENDKMYFGRAKIEKRALLVAKDKGKIDFPVYFTFEFDGKYSISKNGEVVKL